MKQKYRMLMDMGQFKAGETVWFAHNQLKFFRNTKTFVNKAGLMARLWLPGKAGESGYEERIELIQDEQPDWFESLNDNEKEALRLIVAVSKGDGCSYNGGAPWKCGQRGSAAGIAAGHLKEITWNIDHGDTYKLKSEEDSQKIANLEKQKAELESQIEAINRQIEDGV